MPDTVIASAYVHRRTGGLEKSAVRPRMTFPVHRRTGGLEKVSGACDTVRDVHRRTGGLEKHIGAVAMLV